MQRFGAGCERRSQIKFRKGVIDSIVPSFLGSTKHITPTRRSALDDKYLGGHQDTPNKYLAVSRSAINRVRGKSSNLLLPRFMRFVGFLHTSKKITSLITFTNSSTLLHKAIRFENSLLLRNIWNLIFTISESKQNHQLLRWKIRFIDNLSTKFNRATRNEWSSIREWIDR